jgi:hypothetical protein
VASNKPTRRGMNGPGNSGSPSGTSTGNSFKKDRWAHSTVGVRETSIGRLATGARAAHGRAVPAATPLRRHTSLTSAPIKMAPSRFAKDKSTLLRFAFVKSGPRKSIQMWSVGCAQDSHHSVANVYFVRNATPENIANMDGISSQLESWANTIRPFMTDSRVQAQFAVSICDRSVAVAKNIADQFLRTTCGSQRRSSKTSKCMEARHTRFAEAITECTLAWRSTIPKKETAAPFRKLRDVFGCGPWKFNGLNRRNCFWVLASRRPNELQRNPN